MSHWKSFFNLLYYRLFESFFSNDGLRLAVHVNYCVVRLKIGTITDIKFDKMTIDKVITKLCIVVTIPIYCSN